MKILELFAWSRSIWEEAEKLWHEVFSIDYTQWGGIHLVADIYKLVLADLPWIPDVIWASPDCTTYSIAACSTHRNPDRSAKSDYAKVCDEWNKHWLWLMKELQELNPELIYFIENPSWNLKKMDFMQGFPIQTVWYCKYWYKIKTIDKKTWKEIISIPAKPTNIWTNSKTFIWKKCKNHTYDKEWNRTSTHCNHDSSRRWSRTWTQWLKNAHERSKIPKELCLEILKSLIKG